MMSTKKISRNFLSFDVSVVDQTRISTAMQPIDEEDQYESKKAQRRMAKRKTTALNVSSGSRSPPTKVMTTLNVVPEALRVEDYLSNAQN